MKLIHKAFFATSLQALVAATALLFTNTTVEAAAYIKFDGIDGESKEGKIGGWITLESCQLGAEAKEGTTRTSREVGFSAFKGSARTGLASPKLMEALCTGRVIPEVVIHLTETREDGSEETYYKVTLKDVVISSYQTSGSAGAAPVEQFSLNYEEIKVTYVDRDGSSKGNVEFEWKVEEGE